MKEYSSFVSERTIEYVLIPALSKILKQKYTSVIPVFPWMTREGTKLSRTIHHKDKFRVVGLYPRRPKLNLFDSSKLLIKIREEFIIGSEIALKLSIPLIVGSPLIRNIWDLDKDPECVWLRVDETSDLNYELMFDVKLNGYDLSNLTNNFKNHDDLLSFIDDRSMMYSYDEALNAFSKIRRERNYGFIFFYSAPKPIYFLLGKEKAF